MNSLRSLLIGLYGVRNVQDIEEYSFPQIRSYPAQHDPMIDGVTTNADEKERHRKVLFEKHSLPHGFVDFKAVNEKLKRCLGYPNRVNYHVIREHLVCNRSHDLDLPGGLADEDITQQVYRCMSNTLCLNVDLVLLLRPHFENKNDARDINNTQPIVNLSPIYAYT
jgi:hypothetical protein